MSQPWGHKVTFVVYVEGDEFRAQELIDDSMFPADLAHFVGATMEPVPDEPHDQGAA